MKIWMLAAGLAGASLAWCADGNGISAPVTGFVMDGRSHALRPINGIPGAAQLGAPVRLPFALSSAAVSVAQDYALVVAANGDTRPLLARGLRSGQPQTSPIDGAIPASGVVLAESGAVAALYSNADGKLQFLTGLPAAAQALDPIDASALNGGIVALALDSAGQNALLAAGDGNIYWAANRGANGLSSIARVPGASSAAFLPNGDAVVGSAATGDVVLLQGLGTSLSIRTIGGVSTGITSPRAVHALSSHEVGVVDGAAGGLAVIDLDTGSLQWVALAGAADRFELLDSGLLLLNRTGAGPLLLLDTTQGRTTYFVPAEPKLEPHRK